MSPATPEGDSNTSGETDPDLLENNDELLTSDHSVDSEIDHTYQPLPVLEILNRYCKGRGNGEHKDHGVNPAGDHLVNVKGKFTKFYKNMGLTLQACQNLRMLLRLGSGYMIPQN